MRLDLMAPICYCSSAQHLTVPAFTKYFVDAAFTLQNSQIAIEGMFSHWIKKDR